jgi:phospholipid/cholesterol/gamma-HCH transport system substrate-binding protein
MSRIARLGAFMVVALIVFAVMIFWIGDRQSFFSRTYRISAPFDNVAGLEEGAPVRAGGVRIGTVERIHLPHHPDDKISVELQLQNSTRDVIKKDSIASIETEGLLGSKYVAVSFGSLEAEQVSDGDAIESRPPVDYADVAKKAGEMLDTAKEAIDSSKVAIGNVNEATDDLKSITGKIDGGKGTLGALLNDRSMYQSLNATVDQARAGATSFQENMEALKHNFFLRGFFNKRGYFDSSELSKHAVARLPGGTPMRQFTFEEKDLFDKPTTAKLRNEKQLKQVGAVLESNPFGLAVVVAKTGSKGNKEENLKLSQARAMVVRQYLAQNFKVDDSRIKTLGAGEAQQAAGDGSGRLTIMVYPPGREERVIAAKNK